MKMQNEGEDGRKMKDEGGIERRNTDDEVEGKREGGRLKRERE